MPEYKAPGVYIEEVDKGAKPIEGVSTAIAAFIGFAEKGEVGEPRLVTNWTEFKNMYGDFVPGGFLAHAVYGYFNNGGNLCYVTRLEGDVGNGHTNGHVALPVAKVKLPSRTSAAQHTLEITTTGSDDVTVEVRPNAEGAPEEQFTFAVLVNGQERGQYPNLTVGRTGRGARNVVEVLAQEAAFLTVTVVELPGSLTDRAPAVGSYHLERQPVAEAVAASATALAIPDLTSKLFVGDADDGTGILGLERHDNVTMICVPDLMAAYMADKISEANLRAVQSELISYCARSKDRMAILDVPPKESDRNVAMAPDELATWRKDKANYDSAYGAMYYPWIQVADPISGNPIYVPPCGHVAGIWARNDAERGVHKAPANEVVRGAIGLQRDVSQRQQMILNPSAPEGPAINCIRTFPGRGIRVWGARTLASDASWRYVNVRRLFNFVEKSIDNGTQWVVFEPNDFYTWEKVSRDVIAFLTRVWRDGALFGLTQGQAFYVKCDEELNTVEERDAGRMIVEIGIAPVKPAEFVIFRISQYAGQAA
jgi:phage tail sheath protein FI